MKRFPVKASLVALALLSATGAAEAGKMTHPMVPVGQMQDSSQEVVKVRQFLATGNDLSKMKLPRLQQRLHRAETFREVPGLPPDLDQALQEEIARITREITRREQAASDQPPAEPQIEDPPLPPYDPQKAQDPPPAEPQIEDPPLPPYDPQKAQDPPPAEPQIEQPPLPPYDPQKAQPEQQPAKRANVNPALEKQAQAYLNDNADVRTMKRKQLRKRLSDIRDLLATNQLTPETREALRQKLASERAVLRNDVAVDEGQPTPSQPQPQTQQPPPKQQGGNANADERVVLQDRRPPQELDDRALVRRIDVYRGVVADDRYDAEQRMMWQRQMEADRRYLRRQMIEERQQREARLRQGDYQFNYDVQDRYAPGFDVPDDVFAAEADDAEIAGVLAAPPRRDIQRRYTLDDIERYPDARNAMARIEIDTVHFGFGEGYLREEEIDKLDRIASILERILASHPDEVFLIEGHTDAVGSDAANLALSRQRARAVKEALATYYVIPPENLRTVGLGERYLKIPTDQPEAENRRVSLARITPLLGQAD